MCDLISSIEINSNSNSNSNSNTIFSAEFYRIFNYIRELFISVQNITPSKVYNKLIEDNIITPSSDKFPITFAEANVIDFYFFRKGGRYWLDAFSRPNEGNIFMCNDEHFQNQHLRIASNCSIFTFDCEYVDPKMNKKMSSRDEL